MNAGGKGGAPRLYAVINEGLLRQLVNQYFRETRGGKKYQAEVLRELITVTYAQGYQAGLTSPAKE